MDQVSTARLVIEGRYPEDEERVVNVVRTDFSLTNDDITRFLQAKFPNDYGWNRSMQRIVLVAINYEIIWESLDVAHDLSWLETTADALDYLKDTIKGDELSTTKKGERPQIVLDTEDKITMILSTSRTPLVDNLEQHLRLHEHLRKYDIVLKQIRFIAEKIDSRSNKTKPKNNNKSGNLPKFGIFCTLCGRKGHLQNDCKSKTFCTICSSKSHFVPQCKKNIKKEETRQMSNSNKTSFEVDSVLSEDEEDNQRSNDSSEETAVVEKLA
eukprot:augustus_masked-scaffold_26-processed-gene-4.14-mRNA-1 protein AED:1.00 eAED:1.00 QI:0/0/0/0/1/1/3/0/268